MQSAIRRGYRTTPYPHLEQLQLLHELGGRITITSDCHRAEWIDFGFDKSVEIAKAAGCAYEVYCNQKILHD